MSKAGVRAFACLAALVTTASTGCTGAGTSSDQAGFATLESAHQAVDESIDCLDKAPESTLVHNSDGLISTNSIKCTESVEIFHFDSEESKDEIYSILASAEGTVHVAEGRNWFVVDYSDAAVSGKASGSRDLARMAEQLGARYTKER